MKSWGRVSRVLGSVGILAATAGTLYATPAGATIGTTIGNVAFVAVWDGNIGQATYSCPGGTAPNST